MTAKPYSKEGIKSLTAQLTKPLNLPSHYDYICHRLLATIAALQSELDEALDLRTLDDMAERARKPGDKHE
jgi:hypothetical protein